MADTITTRDVATFIGEKASHGENIMRETSHLMSTNRGPELRDQVFSDMIKLQSQGFLPDLELLDNNHNPVSRSEDAFKITEIKSSQTGETVYKMGDNNLRLRDKSDTLRELDGFSKQFEDQRSDPFQVADKQTKEQKASDESDARRTAIENTKTQSDWLECMNEGGDVSPAVKVNDCLSKNLQPPESLKIEQQGE